MRSEAHAAADLKQEQRNQQRLQKPLTIGKRSVRNACRCTPIGAMIGGWRSKQNKCPLAAQWTRGG